MSKIRKEIITCKKCREKFETAFYDSVNVTLNPDLRKKVLCDDIYIHKCPKCGEIHFIVNPILYHDMKNKFMVQIGSLIDVYDFYRMTKNEQGELYKFILDGYIMTGANTLTMAKDKIIALENGLNHKIATIFKEFITSQYIEYAQEHNMPMPESTYLCYDDDKDLSIIIDLINDEEKPNCLCRKFEKDLYKKIEDAYKEQVADIEEFIFNDKMANEFLRGNKMSLGFLKKMKLKVALIEDNIGRSYFAISKDKYKKGDIVLIQENEKHLYKGEIYDIVTDLPLMQTLFLEKTFNVMKKCNAELITTGNTNDELYNDDLKEELIKFGNDKKRTNFPYELVMDADVAVGMITYVKGEKEVHVSNIKELEEFINKNTTIELQTTSLNGKGKYLCVYLDQKDLQKEENLNISNAIYNFNDLINYVIQSPEQFDGISICLGENNLAMPSHELYNTYWTDRILTNDKRVIKLLDNMKENSKHYLDEATYQVLTMIYFDKKTPKEIASELNYNIEKVGDILTNGYKKLKRIIQYNY